MKKAKSIVAALASFCIGALVTFVYSAYADTAEEALAGSVIRLHVIANSDSDADQCLKLKVRDAVLSETEELFAESPDKGDARRRICESIDEIERIARETVREYGYDYPVAVTLSNSDFPTKAYGNVTLPAGTYEALKIVIGEGEGKNWWCVLFPPLCFVDAADAGNEMLKNSLDDARYEMLAENAALPVQIKFKTYEIWQESKLKIKNMIAMASK